MLTLEFDVPNLLAESGEMLHQGAEARVFLKKACGLPIIVKARFSKKYRHPVLDKKLTQKRVALEVRAMGKCRQAGLRVPTVYFVDTASFSIGMEYIAGRTLRAHLNDTTIDSTNQLSQVGAAVATMHAADIVHGDLTTSNFLVNPDGKIATIDFGLSFRSTLAEDKAVDLYVLERAFLSTHPGAEKMFEIILECYEAALPPKARASVMGKLSAVRMRGRKRVAFG